ncbi:hypothetical protein MO973_36575 [Paenibacillus sp. TRM 82003]|uniref:hypothetical protein n=1 Tax=Kineococcus sp. TRM81007 TaxID=2925831 RepID=UPI001F5AC267|nr:hypothetical protein [Kineococcus sp. TRM81007]MCI2239967.1 hypothetical protein [Kineococcus sp. TRM81007]MCI3925728.1 hypothetical protein [Paenibacillus sp. TRM 82003]
MADDPAVSDEQVARALSVYAAMVEHVLSDPQRWLGLDDDPPPTASFPARAFDALRDRALGEVTPASPQWGSRPQRQRVDWWVTRIGISAGLAAATPRFAGALADRIPLQAALGASAAGLAVCATAREHGRSAPADWVPLLAKVLFDRDLDAAAAALPAAEEAEHRLDTDTDAGPSGEGEGGGGEGGGGEGGGGEGSGRAAALGRGAQRAARTVWRLARAFLEVQQMLEERPRGNLLTRAIGKLPVVGVAGGWLDERAGIREAARQTAGLLEPPSSPAPRRGPPRR